MAQAPQRPFVTNYSEHIVVAVAGLLFEQHHQGRWIMKYKLLSLLALSFLFVTGAALAGKGGPIITGIWAGTGDRKSVV